MSVQPVLVGEFVAGSRLTVNRHATVDPVAWPAEHAHDGIESTKWGQRAMVLVLAGAALAATTGVELGVSILLVTTVLITLLGWRHPVIGAIGVTLLCVLDPMAADFLTDPRSGDYLGLVTGGLWRYNMIGYVLALAAVVDYRGHGALRSLPHYRFAVVLMATVLVGLLFTRDWTRGLQLTLDFVAYFGLLAYLVRVARDREAWYWMGAVGATTSALLTFLYFRELSAITHSNPNVVVMMPVTGIFAAWMGFAGAREREHRQLILGALGAVNVLGAFLTTSRGGLVAALVGGVFLFMEIRSVRRRVVIVAVAAALSLALASMFTELQQSAIDRLTLLFDSSKSEARRTSGRSEIAVGALEIFRRNPMGVGTGNFESSWKSLGSVRGQRVFMRSGQEFSPHAGWLRVLAENGVIGFVALGGLVLSFAVVGLRRTRQAGRYIGIGVTVAISVALLSTEFHLKGLFFLMASGTVLLNSLPTSRVLTTVRSRWSIVTGVPRTPPLHGQDYE